MTQGVLNLKKELIWLDVDFQSKEELFREVGRRFGELGYVKSSFSDALAERESKFPTGLATEPFQVAIPHTDPEHVVKEAVSCIRLVNPVKFQDVGDEEIEINAEFIFVLCILEPEKQIDVLKSLVEALSNEEIMNGIKSAKTPDEVYDLLIYED